MAVDIDAQDMTDEQRAICEMVRQFADEQILPNAEHYDHEDEFPEPIVDQMRELGLFGVTIPGGVRRDGARPVDLRDDRRGAVTRVDLDFGDRQHSFHRFLPADEVRLPKSRSSATCRGWPPARSAPRSASLSPSSAPTCRRSRPAPRRPTNRRLRDQWPEDVGYQRPALDAGLHAGADRPDRGAAPPRDDVLHLREGARRVTQHRPVRRAWMSRRRSARWATRAWSRPSWCSTVTGHRPTASSAARTPGLNKRLLGR